MNNFVHYGQNYNPGNHFGLNLFQISSGENRFYQQDRNGLWYSSTDLYSILQDGMIGLSIGIRPCGISIDPVTP